MTSGRTDLSSDLGITLVEIMVATSLFFLALSLFGSVLIVSQRTQIRDSEYSSVNDAVSLAVGELDKQIRSGYVIPDTTPLATTADSVKIFTAAKGSDRCVAWAIYPTTGTSVLPQSLYVKSWNPKAVSPPPFSVSSWRKVLTGIVGAGSSSFTVVPAGMALPQLKLSITLNVARDGRADQAIDFESTFTARNNERAAEPFNNAIIGTTTGSVCGT